MKKHLTILLLTFYFQLFTFNLKAQPTIQWEKSLGGSAADGVFSIDTTIDGGCIVVGQSFSNDGDVTGNNGNGDYWLVKLDATGILQWEKNYGGSGDEVPYVVHQTYDKGYFIAGRTSSNDGDVGINLGGSDIWVLKVDSLGNIQWKQSLGGSSSEIAQDMQLTLDSGYVVVGHSRSNDGNLTNNYGFDDYWVFKLDKLGNIQWEKSLGGSQPDRAYSIEKTSDMGYIVVGESSSNDGNLTGNNGGRDYWIVKLDSIGNIQWQKNYGGSSEDIATSVLQTQDNGYIVVGSSGSNDGDVTGHYGAIAVDDYWIIKLDSLGNLLWQKSLGGTFVDQATDIKQLSDGNYIILGTSASSDGDVGVNYGSWDCWLVKIDGIGNLIWEKNYGGSFGDWGYAIYPTNDNGYIIAAQSTSQDIDVSQNNGSVDYWIIKLNPVVGVNELKVEREGIVYPNPNTGVFYVKIEEQASTIKMYNILGEELLIESLKKGVNRIELYHLPNGIYTIKIDDGHLFYTQKIIINH